MNRHTILNCFPYPVNIIDSISPNVQNPMKPKDGEGFIYVAS